MDPPRTSLNGATKPQILYPNIMSDAVGPNAGSAEIGTPSTRLRRRGQTPNVMYCAGVSGASATAAA